MATNTIYINGIAKNYTISSQPGYNMYGFFDYTKDTTHNMQAATYTPANFNKYTSTARTWAYAFYNRQDLTSIPSYNMSNAVSMYQTFADCFNLTSAPNIPNGVTTMYRTFAGCISLKSAPKIPNSVKDMSGTFLICYNLISAPNIPNSVTNMYETFRQCYNLKSAPNISNGVADMDETFESCYNLISAPNIPNSVTNMYETFYNCSNLTGSFYIMSNNVSNCHHCFYNHNKQKMLNVYIHAGTTTYNKFNTYLGGIDNATLNVHIKTF